MPEKKTLDTKTHTELVMDVIKHHYGEGNKRIESLENLITVIKENDGNMMLSSIDIETHFDHETSRYHHTQIGLVGPSDRRSSLASPLDITSSYCSPIRLDENYNLGEYPTHSLVFPTVAVVHNLSDVSKKRSTISWQTKASHLRELGVHLEGDVITRNMSDMTSPFGSESNRGELLVVIGSQNIQNYLTQKLDGLLQNTLEYPIYIPHSSGAMRLTREYLYAKRSLKDYLYYLNESLKIGEITIPLSNMERDEVSRVEWKNRETKQWVERTENQLYSLKLQPIVDNYFQLLCAAYKSNVKEDDSGAIMHIAEDATHFAREGSEDLVVRTPNGDMKFLDYCNELRDKKIETEPRYVHEELKNKSYERKKINYEILKEDVNMSLH